MRWCNKDFFATFWSQICILGMKWATKTCLDFHDLMSWNSRILKAQRIKHLFHHLTYSASECKLYTYLRFWRKMLKCAYHGTPDHTWTGQHIIFTEILRKFLGLNLPESELKWDEISPFVTVTNTNLFSKARKQRNYKRETT